MEETMPILNCTVGNCRHNKENLCCLDSIKVEGADAKVSDATACGSFAERKEDGYSNSMSYEQPSKTSMIDCAAKNCNYNDNCKCTAGQIQVSGPNAHDNCDTKCSTFVDK
jgi:hypothetical protein